MVVLLINNSPLYNHSTIITDTSQAPKIARPSDFYELTNGFGRLMGLLWRLQYLLDLDEGSTINILLDFLQKRHNIPNNIKGKEIWNILENLFPCYYYVSGRKVRGGVDTENLVKVLANHNIILFSDILSLNNNKLKTAP